MKNINRFLLIILVVLFALGMASLFLSLKHLYKDKPPPSVSEQAVGTMELSKQPKKVAPIKDEVDIPSSENTVPPKQVLKEVSSVKIPESQKKVVSTLESPKADDKVDSSEEPSDVSSLPLNDVLELEKKRAAIIKQLLLEKSNPPKTVPSIQVQRKTWADVGDQLMELEQQRENSINSLSTKVNQQDGK
jgi:hypothetical protein